MRPDVSFLLPTKRISTHNLILGKVLDSIEVKTNVSYEILLSAPDVNPTNEITKRNIRYFRDHKDTKGPISVFNELATRAKGDYLVCCVDDHVFLNSIKECIDMLEEDEYFKRSWKICGLYPGPTCYIPNKGDRMGDGVIEEELIEAPTLRFPVLRKDVYQILSRHIFHPDLVYHAGDIWLGYWLERHNHRVVEGPTKIQCIAPLKDSTHEVQDCNTVYNLIKKELNGKRQYI